MKIDPVRYYYKNLETGVEMEFTKSDMWGWAISFPKLDITESLNYDGYIPWPELSAEEKPVVDRDYEELRNALEEEE